MYAVSKNLGEWRIGCGKYSCFAKSIVSDSGETVAFAVTPAKRGASALAAANASVLADALNVRETTGLTPSQLQARVAELEAAVFDLHFTACNDDDHDINSKTASALLALYHKVRRNA